ncbi:protein BCCIP homolog [Euwallacea similis]|uniref:protein BCCIP homolog n=1 Tax=Euwallacea similis TaxID=1736056 RepID=UPI00344E838D
MAAPNRKSRKLAADDSSSEPPRAQTQNDQVIEATFEGQNLESQDYAGIKLLLQQLFLKANIDLGQMTDMLIVQRGIGTVLKQSYNDSDDEETLEFIDESIVFAVASVINLTSHRESSCVKQFFQLLEEISLEHADKTIQDSLKGILQENNKLGLLINERFINIPAKISHNMLKATFQEMENIKKKDKSYDFDYLILISKTSKPKGEEDGDELYTNDEEVVFTKAADLTFDFSVENADTGLSGRWDDDDQQLVPYRRVNIVKAVKYKDIVDEINTLVN